VEVAVPGGTRHTGFWVNTATGLGRSQVQAAPAVMHYADSARESVGMYGSTYELGVKLRHDGGDAASRRVRVLFSSHGSGSPSRFWDGLGLVDGRPTPIQHTPARRSTQLAEVTLKPGESRMVHFTAMVPGLTSIPQSLLIESLP
jgi:hypothetical protein